MGINEKAGEVFSVAVENVPVTGCTVSKTVAEVAGGYVAHFLKISFIPLVSSGCIGTSESDFIMCGVPSL